MLRKRREKLQHRMQKTAEAEKRKEIKEGS